MPNPKTPEEQQHLNDMRQMLLDRMVSAAKERVPQRPTIVRVMVEIALGLIPLGFGLSIAIGFVIGALRLGGILP